MLSCVTVGARAGCPALSYCPGEGDVPWFSRPIAECWTCSVWWEGVTVSCCHCPSTSPSAVPSVLWEEGWSGHSLLLAEQSHSHCWLLFPLVALWKCTESRGSCLNYAHGQNLFPCFVTDSLWVMGHRRSSTLVGNTVVSLSQNSLPGLQLAQIPGRAGLCAVCPCTVLTLALSSHQVFSLGAEG